MASLVHENAAGASVLVVEDDASVRFGICEILRRLGFVVHDADSCAAAIAAFRMERPQAVVTDLRLPDGDALTLLGRLRALDATAPIFIMTGHGTIEMAVRAVKEGAEDFLTKPVDFEELAGLIRRAIFKRLRRCSGTQRRIDSYVTRSPAMLALELELEKLQDADCSVLILGETGTGKSMLARRIHSLGARANGPFVDVNCGGLSREMVESELFGHERGAYTGAHATKAGLLDSADHGTLFLDEIGDIDVQVQPKILKVVEEKRFRRMGDVRERSVDVRLIAATHHDLLRAAAERRFRADLYYRLSTVTVTLPPLRERPEDIPTLAQSILADLGAGDVHLAPDAQSVLVGYGWPGNIRELKNVLERALLHRRGHEIRALDVRLDTSSESRIAVHAGQATYSSQTMPAVHVPTPSSPQVMPTAIPSTVPMPPVSTRTLAQVERDHIQNVLAEEGGKVDAAAKRLGIPRSTLYQRIREYGILPARFRSRSG